MKLQDLQYGYSQLVNNQNINAQKLHLTHKMSKKQEQDLMAYYQATMHFDKAINSADLQELIRYESWLNGGEY